MAICSHVKLDHICKNAETSRVTYTSSALGIIVFQGDIFVMESGTVPLDMMKRAVHKDIVTECLNV